MWLWLSLLCFSFVFPQTLAENTYSVYIPKYVRPGFNITLTVSILRAGNPLNLSTIFQASDGHFTLQSSDRIESGTSSRIQLGALPIGYDGSTSFSMNLTAVDPVTGDEVFSNSTDDFSFASKALSIYIQTDKAIYQPGQTIKFRGICLKPDLRPLTGEVRYQVQDPNDNIVLLEDDVFLSHGVAGGELELNKDAVVGNWKITFFTNDYKESLSVEVKSYKLPKFKVEVEVPSYIYPGSDGFNVKLKATYTYGKPVKGTGRLQIRLQHPYYYFGPPVHSVLGSTAPQPNTIFKSFEAFDGSEEVHITQSEVTNDLGWGGEIEQKIVVIGVVTETLTSTTFNETVEFDVKSTNIKLEALYKPDTIKPGLNYTAYIKVGEQDGKVLTEEDRGNNPLEVELVYRYPRGHRLPEDTTEPSPWYSPSREEKLNFTLPPDGIVTLTLQAKNDEFETLTVRPYTQAISGYKYSNEWTANRAQSPSNTYLQISTDESTVAPGSVVLVNIRSTEEISSMRILVISRGEIYKETSYTAPSGVASSSHIYELDVTHEMIPNVQVLASYVRSDGEIVADFTKLTVSVALENQVTMSSSAMTVDAGDDVSIRVQTSSQGSYVGLRAIDQSVLLLKSGNDITKERVANDLNDYSVSSPDYDDGWNWGCFYPIPSGAKDANDVFKKAGMIVLTDALLFESDSDGYGGYGIYYDFALDDEAPLNDLAFNEVSVTSVQKQSSPTPRSYFPETWLWTEDISGENGSAIFNTSAPDTITSWILSAFSVSDQHGLGLADTMQITVFRKFFVNLNLPLKITRGEIIVVQAIVFNYLETELQVQLKLAESDKFELLIPGDDVDVAGPDRLLTLPPDGAVSVKFPVRMTMLGEVPITVSAVSELAGDALTRNVYVRPEGVRQCYSTSTLISLESEDEDFSEGLEVRLPQGMVEGSENVKMLIYGDILGSTMSNLGRLLTTPYGCGEQNMLGFAPDVFVTLYLHRAGILDAETRARANKHFHDGYMRELQYKHSDGSYSAFGERDPSGSTWLTAFVAKCFIFARELRPNLVEERIIAQALSFLVSQQNPDGTFREPGKVLHADMQGRVSSPLTMTAYVLIMMKETGYPIKNKAVQEASDSARRFLEANLEEITSDQYALSLVTYALHVSESSRASDALVALEALATTEDGYKYWHDTSADASTYSERWRPPYQHAPTNDIEMTSYALLTYARKGDVGSAIPVIRWLTSKQNELGGYSSTQDTVIAVQAMAQIASLFNAGTEKLTIKLAHSHVDQFSASLSIDQSNSVVVNTVLVPPQNGVIVVSAEGVGVGVAQLTVCYNIPDAPFDNEPFDCSVTHKNEGIQSARVKFCCNSKPDKTSATGMFLQEVGLFNGFTVDVEAEKARNPSAQLIELDDQKVNLYFDRLNPREELCSELEFLRFAEVGEVKPATMVASNYYKPAERVVRQLDIQAMSDAGACDVCASDCAGCPGAMLSEWRPYPPCGQFCGIELVTRVRECIDPISNQVVPPIQCGVTSLPSETMECSNHNFPCPDFHDGLWLGASFLFTPQLQIGIRERRCEIHGRPRSSDTDVPGVALDGSSQQFISCDVFEGFPSTGFTISVLLKPDTAFSVSGKPVTLFALGAKNRVPLFIVEKLWWKEQLSVSINFGRRRYRVRHVPSRKLLLNQWNHVVVTWNEEDGAKLFVNGEEEGRSSETSSRRVSDYSSKMKFYLGRNNFGSSWRKGFYKGALSSFMYWSEVISKGQVGSLYNFFEEILPRNNSSSVLSLSHLRLISPMSVSSCFIEPASLSDIQARSATIAEHC
ncbi:unnamed protein product [Clavelina lepadiformis]|uniref:Uncharacterized protein n=1 Tax=Clavelina lepadiformis TaxID=159417 RepID=A0ABP0FQP4_CLALP